MTLLLTLQVSAQDNKHPRFNPEEFKAKLEAFITHKAGLTAEESAKVFPIYHEMKDKQRELRQKEFKLKKSLPQSDNDKDYQDILDKVAQLHIEAAKIEESYNKKMYKAIPAKKVYAITLAEDAFHREMLKKFNNKPQR